MTNQQLSEQLEFLNTPTNKNFLYQPYHLLLFEVLILTVLPFFFWTQSFVFYIFKTSIFIPEKVFLWSLVIIFLLAWGIYTLTRNLLLNKHLIWIHVVITLLVLTIVLMEGKWFIKLTSNTPQAYLLRQLLYSEVRELKINSWEGIIFIIGQFCFVINLSGGIIRRAK